MFFLKKGFKSPRNHKIVAKKLEHLLARKIRPTNLQVKYNRLLVPSPAKVACIPCSSNYILEHLIEDEVTIVLLVQVQPSIACSSNVRAFNCN
jgi:hypothetical protein